MSVSMEFHCLHAVATVAFADWGCRHNGACHCSVSHHTIYFRLLSDYRHLTMGSTSRRRINLGTIQKIPSFLTQTILQRIFHAGFTRLWQRLCDDWMPKIQFNSEPFVFGWSRLQSRFGWGSTGNPKPMALARSKVRPGVNLSQFTLKRHQTASTCLQRHFQRCQIACRKAFQRNRNWRQPVIEIWFQNYPPRPNGDANELKINSTVENHMKSSKLLLEKTHQRMIQSQRRERYWQSNRRGVEWAEIFSQNCSIALRFGIRPGGKLFQGRRL